MRIPSLVIIVQHLPIYVAPSCDSHTPFPPFNGLLLHVLLRLPVAASEASSGTAILQVLRQNCACQFLHDRVCILKIIEETGVVGITSLIVGQDRAVVGIGGVDSILLRLATRNSISNVS